MGVGSLLRSDGPAVPQRLLRLRLLALVAWAGAAGGDPSDGGCAAAPNATAGAIVSSGAFCPDGYDFPRTVEYCTAAATATGLFEAAAQEQDTYSADLEPGARGVFCALVVGEAGCRTVFVPDGRCSGPDSDRVRALCLPCADAAFRCEPGAARPLERRPVACGQPVPQPQPSPAPDQPEERPATAEEAAAGEALPEEADSGACAADASECAAGSDSGSAPATEGGAAEEPEVNKPCPRPDEWCSHFGGVYTNTTDCDGDGVPDPVCQDNTSAESGGAANGYISSKHGCIQTWPFGTCNRSCIVHPAWCRGKGDFFTLRDCDDDGIPDPYCANKYGRGFLSSAMDCKDTYPNGGCSAHGGRFGTEAEAKRSCPRPEWWCTGEGAKYEEMDCDGDGVPDPHCSQGARRGYLSSDNDCQDSWPMGGCNGSCLHPEKWCHLPGENYSEQDCDGDSIADPVCDDKNGTFFLSSVHFCQVASDCLSTLPPGACKRPRMWCAGAAYSREDCDFDGLPDPVCRKGRFSGYVGSASGCIDTWPNGGCNGTCLRPRGWCKGEGDKFREMDCDGDGIMDPMCQMANGSSGCVSSSRDCEPYFPEDGLQLGCERPLRWCTGPGENFSHEDADFDGKVDAVCSVPGEEYPKGLLSAASCKEVEIVGGRCARSTTWCTDTYGGTQEKADCDGDGRLDVVCIGRKHRIFVSSAHSCSTVPWLTTCRTPVPPRHLSWTMSCPDADGVCKRPELFCSMQFGNFSMFDADGDGIKDPTCVWPGWLGIRRCALVSSRFGCLMIWRTNCTNATSDMADESIPSGLLQRFGYHWLSTESAVLCSLRVFSNSVGRQGRVLWRIVIVRAVASLGLFLGLWLYAHRCLRKCEGRWPGCLGSEGRGVWALQLAALPCRGGAGVWACLCLCLDHELWRTYTFESGTRDALSMMEASTGSGVLQDASVLLPFVVGCMAAELLLVRSWPATSRSAAALRSLHCLARVVLWPRLLRQNWAVRYTVLQVAGELADALEALEWLLRRSRWWRFPVTLCSYVRVVAYVVLRLAQCLVVLRSLRLHPPQRYLFRSDIGEEGVPLVGRELALLCFGCFLLPSLAFLDACFRLVSWPAANAGAPAKVGAPPQPLPPRPAADAAVAAEGDAGAGG